MTNQNDVLHTKLARQVGGAIACLLALALLLGLTACGGGQTSQPDTQSQVPETEPITVPPPWEQTDQPASPEPAAPEPLAHPEEEVDEHDGFPEPEEDDDPQPDAAYSFTQEEYDQLVADVLATIIKDGMTPMEQARAVFNYVHNNIRYTGSSDKSDWMAGAYVGLSTGKGDCFTYYAVSRALLTALEIDNLEVQRVGGKTRHFWNLVNCGDGWYHFDACPRSLKMPSFLSFMVTDEQIAAFTAMAGRGYYDFDDSLLPERATEVVTKTRPVLRPVEPEEDPENAENPEDAENPENSDDPELPSDDTDPVETIEPPAEDQPDTGEEGTPNASGEEGPTDVWTEPPVEEWTEPVLEEDPLPEMGDEPTLAEEGA